MTRRSIKILHLLFQYPQFSGGCYFTEYLDCLAKENLQSTLLSCRYPENVPVPKTKSLDIIWIKQIGIGKVAELAYMIKLFSYLFDKRLKGLDVINCVGPRGLVFANLHRLFFGTKVVCTIEMITIRPGFVGKLLDHLFYFIFSRFFPADLVISWSRYHTEKYLLRWGLGKKLATIPSGIKEIGMTPGSKAKAIRKRYAGGADIFLTFVKPLHRPNGEAAIRIVQAIKVLKDKYRLNCKLLLFKRDREQDAEVSRAIERLELKDNVKTLPFIGFSEAKDYVNASDYIILPYLYETTVSRSLLEAMHAGKLIVTTAQGEVGDIIKDGKNGLITTGDPEDIARILSEIESGKVRTAGLVKAARETVMRQFSQKKNVSLQVEIIRSLINAN